MNITQFYHLMLFIVLATCCLRRIPWWIVPVAAALIIEIDQGMTWASPWWEWFTRADTLLDLAADFVGIGLAWAVWKYLR